MVPSSKKSKTAASKGKPKKARSKRTAPASRAAVRKRPYQQPEVDNTINEPAMEYTAKVRPIGNSKGVILNNQLLETAGLTADQDIVIKAVKGRITIEKAESYVVNTDLSTWDQQFKAAIKAGDIPEGDLWEGLENEFDKTEW